jgi:hypothetical protein
VLARGDDYTNLDSSKAIAWTLLPDSYYDKHPLCTDLTALLHSLEYGSRGSDVTNVMATATDTDTATNDMNDITSNHVHTIDMNTTDHIMEPSTHFIPAHCSMQWFTSMELCQIFSGYSEIVMIGDSMHRHTLQALPT